jgi:hypothetical protein
MAERNPVVVGAYVQRVDRAGLAVGQSDPDAVAVVDGRGVNAVPGILLVNLVRVRLAELGALAQACPSMVMPIADASMMGEERRGQAGLAGASRNCTRLPLRR